MHSLNNRKKVSILGVIGVAAVAGVLSVLPVGALTLSYNNELLSISTAGVQENRGAGMSTAQNISKDGRYVVFSSGASNLVSGGTTLDRVHVYVRDRANNTTSIVDTASGGGEADSSATEESISANGRYVVFMSGATNIAGGASGYYNVFLKDLSTGTTELVSKSSSGFAANNNSSGASISSNGRFVAFRSLASNLASGDTNGQYDIFVRDRKLSTTTLLSKSDSGSIGNSYSAGYTSMSCDGSVIAFNSNASNLVTGDTNGTEDIFVVQRTGGDTIRSITLGANDYNTDAQVSCDGSAVTFGSYATNLVGGDTNNMHDIFKYDLDNDAVSMVNLTSSGAEPTNGETSTRSGISGDGRYVVFQSSSDEYYSGDTNGVDDVFVRDTKSGTTNRVSMRDSSTSTVYDSVTPSISADASVISFSSSDTGLVTGDTNSYPDMFTSETDR